MVRLSYWFDRRIEMNERRIEMNARRRRDFGRQMLVLAHGLVWVTPRFKEAAMIRSMSGIITVTAWQTNKLRYHLRPPVGRASF
jgi:hypothetical protein